MFIQYSTKKFDDVYSDADSFKNSVPTTIAKYLTTVDLDLVYFLLQGRYGQEYIMSTNEDVFKNRLMSILFQYAPTWAKDLEIQQNLIKLSENDIISGSTAIYNHAYNPGTAPSTATLEELTAINDQNVTKYKKSKLEGYGSLVLLLQTDVTEQFLVRFQQLFTNIVINYPNDSDDLDNLSL